MLIREFDYEKEPVVSIVKKILTDAVKMKVSDIHFDPTPTELSIKFRINGNLQEYTNSPESFKSNITTRIKILSGMNITDSLRPQTGAINFESEGKHHNMRVTSLPICDGEKIVIHIHSYENSVKSLSKMGINPEDTEKIKRLIKGNQGLVLITGTTHSGKTTTMYAMLKEIHSKAINIISIEEPVKLKIEGINQVEIAPDKGITYKNALKHVMLQDPNIICIDNLIDDEIARDAIRASITGRLVVSSLYTKNAYTTIDALLNMEIENYLLGSNLNGIISQRLVKQLCPKCKEKRKATEYEKTVIKKILNKDIDELYYPKGCTECHNGYTNQTPVVEVIEITDELKNAITNKKPRNIIRELLYKNNNTIIIDGFNKVLEGITSFNEIIRITDVKNDFSEDETDIKEYILGNGTPTTAQILNHLEEKAIEEKNKTTTEVTTIPEEVTEEVPITEITPVVEETKTETTEEIVESPTQVNNTNIEETTTTNEEEKLLEEINQLVEEDTNKEETNLINEINQLVEEDVLKENNLEEDNALINEINQLIEEDITETTTIDSETKEIEEPILVTEETSDNEESLIDNILADIANDENNVTEEEKTIEETPVVEEATSVVEPVAEQKEVTIPAPIEANIVDEKSQTSITEDDEDDEDDFGYGEEYENTF